VKTVSEETTLQAPTPTPPPVHVRVRHGLRRPHNWVQLVKFVAVGGTGYAVNIGVYALVHEVIGIGHLRSAGVAFLVAVLNNFWWNRHWTFGARAGHAGFQAARFFAVSVAAFFVALGVSQTLVSTTDLPDVVAQAISIVAATPLNFIGNKMWSFGHGVRRR
jgi:dolichol-phosphate mannosyltransferase